MSGKHCENYDVKRETVHCYPRNVDRCCTWSLESQRGFQILLLFCYITNHLMTGPEENSEFCFPRMSVFSETKSWETLIFSGNEIHCSPRDHSSSVYCYIARLSFNKISTVIGWFLVTCSWSNSNISRPRYNCAVVCFFLYESLNI